MERFACTLILIIVVLLLGFMPSAFAASENGLDKEKLFTENDMQQSADRHGAKVITLSDERDVVIESAGTWVLHGSASNVMICVDIGENDELRLIMDGVNISNRDRPCIYVKKAGKLIVTVASDSTLSVHDSFWKDSKLKGNGVIYSRSDLTLNGDARLTVTSMKNGIVCKDKLRITGGNYVISAGSKAIAADNAIWIMDGSFRLTAGTDGLHAENEEDDRKGSIFIGGGSLEIEAGDDGIHGQSLLQIEGGNLSVHADEGLEGTWVLINGGTLDIRASGDGINAGWKSDTYCPKIEINGGQISIVMKGEDTDAIDSNTDLIITGGTIELSGSGIDYDGKLVFTGGTVIIDGEEVQNIPNQSTHRVDS